MTSNRKLTRNIPCKSAVYLSSKTINLFKSFLKKKHEISGRLVPKTVKSSHSFIIDSKKLKNGGKDETDIIEHRYTFHTHPKEAYIMYNTELGFPSKSDFEVYLESFINFQNILHLVVTLEGVYAMSINPYFFGKKISKREGNKYISKYFSIDKQDFTKKKGIKKCGVLIKTPAQFVRYVNKKSYKNKRTLFKLKFIPWNKIHTTRLLFYYPKINNKCIISEDKIKDRKFVIN
tara:strand:- start:1891 stop:2589 length:699 start_codon:yes stop_codon:yes gene_type:complete